MLADLAAAIQEKYGFQIGYSNPGIGSLVLKKYGIKVVEEGVTGVYRYTGAKF